MVSLVIAATPESEAEGLQTQCLSEPKNDYKAK